MINTKLVQNISSPAMIAIKKEREDLNKKSLLQRVKQASN